MATKQRPYQFGRLLTSTILGRGSDSYWEAGLGKSFAAKYGHPAFVGTGFFLPPRVAARDLLTSPASAAGDLVGESIAIVATSVRPTLVLEQAGMWVIETAGDMNINFTNFSGAASFQGAVSDLLIQSFFNSSCQNNTGYATSSLVVNN